MFDFTRDDIGAPLYRTREEVAEEASAIAAHKYIAKKLYHALQKHMGKTPGKKKKAS